MALISIQFLLIVLLMLANGFFAASEIAVVSARRGRLQQQAEAGNRNARIALDLAAEPNHFLATVQVEISLIGTFAAAFGGDVLADPLAGVLAGYIGPDYARAVALTAVVLLLTYLSLILGELVPKRLALQRAEAVATFAAPIMRLIARLAAPVIWFLTLSTRVVLRLLGRSDQQEEEVTEEDVLSLVREGTEAGTVEPAEQKLIERVFEFADCTARSIMTPRTEVFALDIDTSFDDAVVQVLAAGYFRIPVYRGAIDTVVGVLYVKELLRATNQASNEPTARIELGDLLRPPVFVLEHQRVAALLQQFKETRTHLAMVIDEYGQVDGLVTLEDVLEELTGDIDDEYDEGDTSVVERPDGSYLVDGLISYTDAQERIGLPAKTDSDELPAFDTIAGLLLALLQHIPTAGETVTWRGWRFEIVDMDGVRIDKILAHPPAPTEQSRDEGALAIGALGSAAVDTRAPEQPEGTAASPDGDS